MGRILDFAFFCLTLIFDFHLLGEFERDCFESYCLVFFWKGIGLIDQDGWSWEGAQQAVCDSQRVV